MKTYGLTGVVYGKRKKKVKKIDINKIIWGK